MDVLTTLRHWIAPETIVSAGYAIMALVIFAETGLLAGFFLPGDSLLVTAGIFAARGDLDLLWLNGLLTLCAIVGDATGYFIGRRAGAALFDRPDSRFFKRKYVEQTQAFYDKHGGKTIILARFVPIVRTFAPTMAGVAKMHYPKFAAYNIFGGIFWVMSMTLTGYFLGKSFPTIAKDIDKVIIVVVAISLLPVVWHLIRERYMAPAPAETPAE
ncbi:MAG: VTT domain-containing protein [Chloroherpetonaceae bacterium]|nr:VTT domain-containing protein [Chloroherpetonaceae bacterium]MCS7210827.1 VTT domain-containing protein [Chloroherpetonaceae bacterium]MDW8020494.1 VTT domain-containing protein [Chloroherpetonaceae bacterium]MDW8465366.1 VTT domain-containing protein [Chloroherpetonaceae bacterium]